MSDHRNTDAQTYSYTPVEAVPQNVVSVENNQMDAVTLLLQSFGNLMFTCISTRKMSIEQAAEKAGLTASRLRDIITGQALNEPLATYAKIAALLEYEVLIDAEDQTEDSMSEGDLNDDDDDVEDDENDVEDEEDDEDGIVDDDEDGKGVVLRKENIDDTVNRLLGVPTNRRPK